MTSVLSTLVRDGAVLHVDDAGGIGFPAIFQHGLCGDARQPAEVFPRNSALRRVTLECRAHGSSESGDFTRFSLATFTDDVIALVEMITDRPVVVGGISMGAALALRIAVKRPDLVRGVILARPAWLTAAAPENMRANIEVGKLLATLAPEAGRHAFLASATGQQLAHEAPDNLSSLTSFFDRRRPVETAALLQAIASDGPDVTSEELGSLDVPTLVIGTARDLIHPMAYAKTLAGLIPNARLVEITSKAENRERYVSEFTKTLNDFLGEFI